jgi:hypothetical protein
MREPEASTGWRPAVQNTVPTYRAHLAYPPGLDETRLAVFDGDVRAAETTWRPSSNVQPGPAYWDWQLNQLGYHRRSRWQPDALGFRCDVEPIIREGGET